MVLFNVITVLILVLRNFSVCQEVLNLESQKNRSCSPGENCALRIDPYSFLGIEDTKTLEFVTVIFRHGERTPTDNVYIFDTNENYFPYGRGQLTNKGKQREYNIGMALRSRYSNFLGTLVSKGVIDAQSSEIDRAQHSLLLVLASLYPPRGPQFWNILLNWQPITVRYKPLSQDKVFFGFVCNNVQNLQDNTKGFQEIEIKYADTFEYLRNKTGDPNFTAMNGIGLYLNFEALLAMGVQLPQWTCQVYPYPLRNISVDVYNVFAYNDTYLRFAAGFMMDKILHDWASKINSPSTPGKISLYSGHEVNVVFMLKMLNVYQNDTPPGGSYVTLELHKIGSQYGVKILYENYSGGYGPKTRIIPGCQEICPFDRILEIVQDRIPGPEDSEACTNIAI